jgi:hypothetical protein
MHLHLNVSGHAKLMAGKNVIVTLSFIVTQPPFSV